MLTESLKLNDDKSEFLVIGTPRQFAKVNTHCIRVGDCNVTAVSSARNLGSWFDTKLSMATHITKLSGSCFYYLYIIFGVYGSTSLDGALRLMCMYLCNLGLTFVTVFCVVFLTRGGSRIF